MTVERIVVIGGGLAGAGAALELRRLGHEGALTLIGAETHLPYNRPPLSKTFLRGEEDFDSMLVASRREYDAAEIDLRLGRRAVAIDPVHKHVELEDSSLLDYDRLLVATGGRKRPLPFPGSELDGIYDLRTIDDCTRIRDEARPGRRVVVVGLGFIGCEVAASLRMLGLEVTALDPLPFPLSRVLGDDAGRAIAGLHRDRGVELVLGEGVERFEGDGRVQRVISASGRVLECDFVVAGIGIQPDVALLENAGAIVSNGVEVDDRCRTSLRDVFAAGDIADHLHPLFGRIRVEHWNNADRQGRFAAAAMLDQEGVYDYVHSFWSDQYDQTLEYVGFAQRWDRLEVDGSLDGLEFIVRYFESGRLVAAAAIGRGGDPEAEGDSELKTIAGEIRRGLTVRQAG
jgi:3-phenylpropionate/trans-cinnamate dioxygenase ferredoxin reductase subunit